MPATVMVQEEAVALAAVQGRGVVPAVTDLVMGPVPVTALAVMDQVTAIQLHLQKVQLMVSFLPLEELVIVVAEAGMARVMELVAVVGPVMEVVMALEQGIALIRK